MVPRMATCRSGQATMRAACHVPSFRLHCRVGSLPLPELAMAPPPALPPLLFSQLFMT